MKNKKSKVIANIFCIMVAVFCIVMLSGIAIQQEQKAYAVENQQESKLLKEVQNQQENGLLEETEVSSYAALFALIFCKEFYYPIIWL